MFFTTEFVVVYDAQGYEEAGGMMARGWADYLRHGPQREPLFPWLVALSMRWGQAWGMSYHYPLKFFGLLFLALTLVLTRRLMGLLEINRFIAYAAVLYLGFSPTMSTSCLRLWSEFAAYPWVVLAVIWTIEAWAYLEQENPAGFQGLRQAAGHGARVAAAFLGIMAVKAIAEGVLLFFLWPFYAGIFLHWRRKNRFKTKQFAVFCLSVVLVFEGVVCAYKAGNALLNGHFAFTNRGEWALYGNTARRMQPLTLGRLGAAAAYAVPLAPCAAWFGEPDCQYWSARHSDDIIDAKRAQLNAQGITGEAASHYYLGQSISMLLANPAQALLLMFIEAHKMFFWEPSLSFEVFPHWLEKIFYAPRFVEVLMTAAFLASWMGFWFALFLLCRRWRRGWASGPSAAAGWVWHFVFWYMALYSLYFVIDRYAFPIVPLYVALAAFMADAIRKVLRRCFPRR